MIKVRWLISALPLLVYCQISLAESWLDEGIRELEELRLRQLKTVQSDSTIAPFTTDGCSGGQSTMWRELAHYIPEFEKQFAGSPPWVSCCVAHDKAYWKGETIDEFQHRLEADKALQQCVLTVGQNRAKEFGNQFSLSEDEVVQAFSITAELMYRAVRLGGAPCSVLPWRWGYGWDHCAFSAPADAADNH